MTEKNVYRRRSASDCSLFVLSTPEDEIIIVGLVSNSTGQLYHIYLRLYSIVFSFFLICFFFFYLWSSPQLRGCWTSTTFTMYSFILCDFYFHVRNNPLPQIAIVFLCVDFTILTAPSPLQSNYKTLLNPPSISLLLLSLSHLPYYSHWLIYKQKSVRSAVCV